MNYLGRHEASGDVVLMATDVCVAYGGKPAVREVTLSLAAGDLVAVTGPSGAGKTSLLCALAGHVDVSAGSVRRDGRPLVLIPQGNALAAVLTAWENVAVPLLATADTVRGARDAALAAMTSVGVQDAAEQLIDELSGGQQQRVAVARGVAQRGGLLLADEPTSELDSANRGIVMELLRGESRRGAAVVVATHDPEAADLCDAELRLDDGVASWVRDDR